MIQNGTPATETSRHRTAGQPQAVDLLIVGGGILGLSVACEVLARGLSVTVFETNPKASATWASAGMLSPYAEHAENGAMQDMLRAARVGYPAYVSRVEEHSGMKIELSFPGTLLPGSAGQQPEELEAVAQRFRDLGARARHLGASAVAWEEPQLAPSDAGAVLLEDEGYVNPRSLLTALRASFDHLGGRWVSLEVLGLVSRQGTAVGVETAAGAVLGGAVLNAAGAWADRFLLPEDLERHRLRPIRGQIIRLRPAGRADGIRRVIQRAGVGYLVPRADGSIILGATSEEVGPFSGVTGGGVRSLLESARSLVPCSENWAFLAAWSGLRPLAGEGEPVLGTDSARQGLFHGLGLYRHGVLLAPVAATRMSRLILEYLGRWG